MKEYTPKPLKLLENIRLDLRPVYGAGFLEVKPQEGPQMKFISMMGGMGGEDLGDQDFPLIFYGGAK